MAEKAKLVDKIPAVGSKPTEIISPFEPIPSKTETPQASTNTTDIAAVESVESAPAVAEEQTITAVQSTAYYSFLGNTLVIGAIGFIFAAKAFKNTKSVNFKVSAGFAGFSVLMAMFYFFMKGQFAGYLNGVSAAVGLDLRGFAWVLFGPSLFFVLSSLDSIKIQNKATLTIPIVLAAAIFSFIGLAQIETLSQGLRLAFCALAIICSASLTLGIFTFLAKLPDEMDDNFIKGFQIVVLVIACGWLFYPMLNMISLFVYNTALFHLLLNMVDVLSIAAIAYGFHVCMTFKLRSGSGTPAPKNIKKPKVVKPKSSPSARSLTD